MEHIASYDELQQYLNKNKTTYLLLYKRGSESSECAVKNIAKAHKDEADYQLVFADVTTVRDIHGNYGITTVPTLLEFQGTIFKKTVKGCNSPNFYKNIFENIVRPSVDGTGKKQTKNVVVYSTPSCPWCNKLKAYLRENNIAFRDIDVSKDQNAAQRMMRSTGQQGVPQTEINGQFVVGFDKPKIDRLLNINPN